LPRKRPSEKFVTATQQAWVPSRFNLAVDLPHQRKAVLNTFTGALVVIGTQFWRRHLVPGCEFRSLQGKSAENLVLLQSQGLLVSKDVDELDLVRVRYLSEHFRDSRLSVTLVPTLACNLSCSYCFEGNAQSLNPVRAWTEERENQVVQHIAKAASGMRTLDVCWFGGEPLLCLKTISRISSLLIPACEQAGMEYSSTLVTNGTLLNREAVAALEKCRLKYIQVTVDIPTSEKRDRRGGGTIEVVLDNLAFAAGKIPVNLRINLVRDDPAEFERLYDALVQRNLHQKLNKFHFAYVFAPECGPSGCHFAAMHYPAFTQVNTRERRRAKLHGLPVDEGCQPQAIGCLATMRNGMVIGTDALLYKCPQDVGLPDRSYGSVSGESAPTPPNLANLVPWLMYDWLQYEDCAQCPALPGCGGGCPHVQRYQPKEFKNMEYCECFLHMLRERIRDRALANPGSQSGALHVVPVTAPKAGVTA
jgi:uncharacterized protein